MRPFIPFLYAVLVLWQQHVFAGGSESFQARTPEVAVSTFYLAIAKQDRDLLKRVDLDPVWATNEQIKKMSDVIVAFAIVARGPMKSGEGMKAGDMYVRTAEYFSTVAKPGKRHFQLRNVGGGWMIVNFNVDND